MSKQTVGAIIGMSESTSVARKGEVQFFLQKQQQRVMGRSSFLITAIYSLINPTIEEYGIKHSFL